MRLHFLPGRTADVRATPSAWRVLALLLVAAFATPGPLEAMVATGIPVAGFETYDEKIPAFLEKWDLPGATIAVAIDGKIVFARGYGLADIAAQRPMLPDTRGRIGSVSKVVTASAVLKLVEQGRLSLTDRAFPLLGWPTPTYEGAARDPRLDQITIAELLSHTGGWNADTAVVPFSGGIVGFQPGYLQRDVAMLFGLPPPASAETICRAMVGQPLQAAPGTAYAYSNVGFMTLGRVIEHVTGQTYEDAVRDLLADSGITQLRIGGGQEAELFPDEMKYYHYAGAALMQSQFTTDTLFVPEPYAYSLRTWDSTGGWTLSAIEGVRLLLALEGNGSTPPLLSPALATAMRTEHFPGTGYGYGWVASSEPVSPDGGHNGGMAGTFASAVRSPDGRCHTFIIFNRRPADVNGVVADLLPLLHALAENVTPPGHDFTTTTLDWEAWARNHFGTVAIEPLDDADGDGLTNLVEYAAGLDPRQSDAVAAVSIGYGVDGVPLLTYRRIALEAVLSWWVEYSPDGLSWLAATEPPSAFLNADGTLSCTLQLPGASRARVHVRGRGVESVLERAVPIQPGARVVNLSARATVGQGENALAAGFVVGGDQPRTLLIRAAGPALAALGVGGTLPHPRVALFQAGKSLAENHRWWENSEAIAATTKRVGAFPFSSGSDDAAMLVTLQPGAYSAQLVGQGGAIGNALLELYEVDGGTSHLINVSARARVGGASGELIAGLVIAGNEPRRVLVRACGPSLRAFGVADALPAPLLRLVDQSNGHELLRNSGWTVASPEAQRALRDDMARAGAFALPEGSADAAAVVTLSPGLYSVVVTAANGGAGVALAEVYELP